MQMVILFSVAYKSYTEEKTYTQFGGTTIS